MLGIHRGGHKHTLCSKDVLSINLLFLEYIKLLLKLIENKLIIYALGNLQYKFSIEKFEPEPGFEPPENQDSSSGRARG